jgi:prefoldin beta subunit
LSQPELPPYLREQLARYEQVQQNLQAVMIQKQQVEMELSEKKELGNTRKLVLAKQESRFRANLKELQTKIDDAVKGKAQQAPPEDQ